MPLYIEVVLKDISRSLDQLYTYEVSEDFARDLEIGDRVVVPFGRGDRYLDGLVWRFCQEPDFPTKPIVALLGRHYRMSPSQLLLIAQLRRDYGATYDQCYSCVLPSAHQLKVSTFYRVMDQTLSWTKPGEELALEEVLMHTTKSKLVQLIKNGLLKKVHYFDIVVNERMLEEVSVNFTDLEAVLLQIPRNAVKRRRLVEHVFGVKRQALSLIMQATQTTRKDIMFIVDQGLASYHICAVEADALNYSTQIDELKEPELTPDQVKVLEDYFMHTTGDGFPKAMLEGVTGSGKTRVYIETAKHYLQKGCQVLVLVPEIALTPQLVNRFSSQLTKRIAVLHNRVSPRDKSNYYKRIANGDVQVIIGARSAIFAPFKELGLIIIDEEHENSFRSDTAPRYDARELALALSHKLPCSILMGSATPSLESKYLIERGLLKELVLTKRIGQSQMPEISIVDLRQTQQVMPLVTQPLKDALDETFSRGEQAIILHNRKGYAHYSQCATCGTVEKCMNCDIPLTVYKNGLELRCHYCGYKKTTPTFCGCCHAPMLTKGYGLDQLVEAFKDAYPNVVIASLDADKSAQQENYIKTLEAFDRGDIQLLIGTQVLAKGLDFPKVSCVGVLLCDQMLNMPDYSASERTIQLLLQVAGRAGRHHIKGRVFMQTFQPDHPIFAKLVHHNYTGFADEEKRLREVLDYPPYGKIFGIRILGEQAAFVERQSYRIYDFYKKNFERLNIPAQIFPPNAAYYGKIKNKYVYHIMIKSPVETRGQMIKMLYLGLIKNQYNLVDVKTHVDFAVNPTFIG
jgi:primosomal protein N' (replication factor Y)